MAHNIIHGRVTRRERRNGTPNWLKALYAILTALVLVTLIGAVFGQ